MTQVEEMALLDKVKEQATEVLNQFKADTITKDQFDKMFGDLQEGMTKAQKDAFDELTDTVKLQAQVLDQLKNMRAGAQVEKPTFGSKFAEGIEANFENIKQTSQAFRSKFEIKVVGDMTLPANLTGTAVKTYGGAVYKPNRKVHMRDLISIIQSSTGLYTFYRETGSEGAITRQTDQNVAKTQIDYDFTEVVVSCTYLAGYAVIHKSMLQDLPFLQSGLPQMLLRDFYKAEDADLWTGINAVATAGVSAATVDIEQVIDYIAQVMAADYDPNGILINPADWAGLVKTTTAGGGYGVPAAVSIDAGGGIAIAGIPVYVSTLVPADSVLVGDFTQAQLVVVDGLKVEFFEQDVDNVRKNKITVRVEAREGLAVLAPAAFVKGDFGNVALAAAAASKKAAA